MSSGSVFEPSVIASDDSTKQAILLDGAVWPLPHLLRKVIPILHRGLEKRVKLLSILPEVDAKVGIQLVLLQQKISIVLFYTVGTNEASAHSKRQSCDHRVAIGYRPHLLHCDDGSTS